MIIEWSSGCARATNDSRDLLVNHKPVLLLHCNGTDAATSFPDSSPSNHTVTAVGNAQVDTAQSKFSGASALFDGTGDYLTIPDSANWNLGAGNFTIDFWVRFAAVPTANNEQGILGQYDDDDNYYALTLRHSGTALWLSFYVMNVAAGSGHNFPWTPVVDTWYHVALIRGWGGDVSKFNICINGTGLSANGMAATWTIKDLAAVFHIGSSYFVADSAYRTLNGWMDEVRIVKGTAVWKANFSPPSRPYMSWG